MKIRITERLPVEERIRPIVGGIYEVVETETDRGQTVYFIKVGGERERVGVFARECEIINERSVCEAVREVDT